MLKASISCKLFWAQFEAKLSIPDDALKDDALVVIGLRKCVRPEILGCHELFQLLQAFRGFSLQDGKRALELAV